MHIYFKIRANNYIEVPIHYNQIIQAAIYNSIDRSLLNFSITRAIIPESAPLNFLLFSFSRLLGRFKLSKEKGVIRFFDEADLVISSPVTEFCQSLANGLMANNTIRLGTTMAYIESMSVRQFKATAGWQKIYLLF